jgi:hypothetical protein
MPGQDGPANERSLAERAALAWIKRRMQKETKKMSMLSVGDKSGFKSKSVWGRVLIAAGTFILAVGHVLTGDETWGHVAQVAQQMDVVGIVLGIVGMVVEGFGQRKATGRAIVAAEDAQRRSS